MSDFHAFPVILAVDLCDKVSSPESPACFPMSSLSSYHPSVAVFHHPSFQESLLRIIDEMIVLSSPSTEISVFFWLIFY